jgi:hypothetical protein
MAKAAARSTALGVNFIVSSRLQCVAPLRDRLQHSREA